MQNDQHTQHGTNLGVVVHDALWVSAAVISRVRVRDAPTCQHQNQIGHEDLSYLVNLSPSGRFFNFFVAFMHHVSPHFGDPLWILGEKVTHAPTELSELRHGAHLQQFFSCFVKDDLHLAEPRLGIMFELHSLSYQNLRKTHETDQKGNGMRSGAFPFTTCRTRFDQTQNVPSRSSSSNNSMWSTTLSTFDTGSTPISADGVSWLLMFLFLSTRTILWIRSCSGTLCFQWFFIFIVSQFDFSQGTPLGSVSSPIGTTSLFGVSAGLTSAPLCHARFPTAENSSHHWFPWVSLLCPNQFSFALESWNHRRVACKKSCRPSRAISAAPHNTWRTPTSLPFWDRSKPFLS